MGLRGRPCSVCNHPQRHLIEVGLTHRLPLKILARRFDLSHDAVFRHRKYHLSPQTMAAIMCAAKPGAAIDLEELRKTESEGLLGNLIVQRARLQTLFEIAVEERMLGSAASIERAYTENLKLSSQMLGMLATQHIDIKSTAILISSDWLQVRGAILGALKHYPEALREVTRALHELERQAADHITTTKTPYVLPPIEDAGLAADAAKVTRSGWIKRRVAETLDDEAGGADDELRAGEDPDGEELIADEVELDGDAVEHESPPPATMKRPRPRGRKPHVKKPDPSQGLFGVERAFGPQKGRAAVLREQEQERAALDLDRADDEEATIC